VILALQTTTFGVHGGIPTYNRLVCRVLNDICEADQSQVLIATDKASDIERPAIQLENLRLKAFDQNRRTLMRHFVRLALTQQFALALMGHVNYAPLGCVLKSVQPKMRNGVMLYGIEAWQRLPLLRRRALQRADFLIAISDYTKQRAIEANSLKPERIYVLPNALEWEVEPTSIVTQSPTNVATSLLSVCRLEQTEQYKGVDTVIEALPYVARRVPDIEYVVVGGGTDLQRHKLMAQRLGVANRVQFLGFLNDDALRACYRRCDLFVMPSAGEGFGFVFLEAMRYGKAIVAAKSGGAPEVIQDGITGSLVAYGNKEQLAETIIGLCFDQTRRLRLGEAGYERLQKRFTYAHFKQRLTEIVMLELQREAGYRSSRSDESVSCAS